MSSPRGLVQTERTNGKSAVVSVRLPVEVVANLRQEASLRGAGFNGFAKEALTNRAQYNRYSTNLPMLPVPSVLIASMLRRLDVKGAAVAGTDSGRELSRHLSDVAPGGLEVEGVIGLLKAWLEHSSMDVSLTTGERYTCVIKHDLGMKWSVLLANLVQSTLEGTPMGHRFKFKPGKDSLTFSVSNHTY